MKVILGLGKSGLSCVRYFVQNNIPCMVMDTRDDPPSLELLQQEFPSIQIHLGEFDLSILNQAEEIIASPGLALPSTITKLNIPISGDIELFARVAPAPVVAITGTNAKGTVTTLVGDMIQCAGLKVSVGGNIGTPALALLTEAVPDFYVLEISSFQLETTYSLKPHAASILNISEDHLDRHKTMASYIAAKQRIYQNCLVAIYNRDDQNTYPILSANRQLSFSLSEPQSNHFGIRNVDGEHWLAYGEQNLLSVNALLIKGKHNWLNALAALALGSAIQLPLSAMLEALKSFKGLEHRCEWVIAHNGITWYDDSKGTNVGATLAAIEGLGETSKEKLILIAGGVGKGADFTQLRESVKKYVKTIILIGQDAPLIEQALNGIVPMYHAKNMEEAVLTARRVANKGDAVLLSPACASLDMFRDYNERGDIFKKLVRTLCV